MKLHVRDLGDWVKFRNIVIYKAFKGRINVNGFIKYRLRESKRKDYKLKNLIDVSQIRAVVISNEIKYVGKMALSNRFNLLGSGWVSNNIDDENGEKNIIGWNRDVKTGYVWTRRRTNEIECIDSPYGVDIKNVWELGRMNYIVPLSLYIAGEINYKTRAESICHYMKIISNFIESNPVGKGVDWVLAMEPSIRLSNILISFDIVRQEDDTGALSEEFVQRVQDSVYAHIKFIWNNLEKNIFAGKNGNHYYSNIVGLLMGTGYLAYRDAFADKLYEYARKEFLIETENQFYEGGGHFEQSTGYFRITAEMAVFGVAILLRNGEDIPESIIRRIEQNGILAAALRRNDGSYYSFGDCDSGYFIQTGIYGKYMTNIDAEKSYRNLDGYCHAYGEDEFFLDVDDSSMTSLINYTKGLTEKVATQGESSIEEQIIRSITGGVALNIEFQGDNGHNKRNEKKRTECNAGSRMIQLDYSKDYPVKKTTEINIKKEDYELLTGCLFREMGFYILKGGSFSLLFRFGNDEGAGHGHNDSLHVEYENDGVYFGEDPGTYSYTGCPDFRNLYRSTAVHNVPQYGCEQREYKGIFGYCTGDHREIIEHSERSIAVRYINGKYDHIRRILAIEGKVQIEDYGKSDYHVGKVTIVGKSPAYGVIERGSKSE